MANEGRGGLDYSFLRSPHHKSVLRLFVICYHRKHLRFWAILHVPYLKKVLCKTNKYIGPSKYIRLIHFGLTCLFMSVWWCQQSRPIVRINGGGGSLRVGSESRTLHQSRQIQWYLAPLRWWIRRRKLLFSQSARTCLFMLSSLLVFLSQANSPIIFIWIHSKLPFSPTRPNYLSNRRFPPASRSWPHISRMFFYFNLKFNLAYNYLN